MYTDAMRRAFKYLEPTAPKGFRLEIIDHENFLTVKAAESMFLNLGHQEKIEAVQYMISVKKALEMEGAIVLLTRDGSK
jgi:hypothetical protein